MQTLGKIILLSVISSITASTEVTNAWSVSPQWRKVVPLLANQCPPAAFSAGVVVSDIENSSSVVVFGGLTTISPFYNGVIWHPDSNSSYSNMLWWFSGRFYAWKDYSEFSSAIPSRAAHTMVGLRANPSNIPVAGDVVVCVVFGGTNGKHFFNDAWTFSVSSSLFSNATLISISSVQRPAARWGHSAYVVNGSMFVFGGFLDFFSEPSDPIVWQLVLDVAPLAQLNADTAVGAWVPIMPAYSGTAPLARAFFYFMALNVTTMVVAGGVSSGTTPPLNDTFFLSFSFDSQV